jgi:adenosylcobalamin-dependent ribonucleoside-triphosphate reductase
MFEFDAGFLSDAKFVDSKSPFGFNGLGELVYRRTYARENEQWIDTCARVVTGAMDMLSEHVSKSCELASPEFQQKAAQEMFERMFFMKFLPPGRGIWAMGSSLTREKKLYAALNNCGFVSTKDLAADPISPFTFLMDASMLGVGIGFDTKGADTVMILPLPVYSGPEDECDGEEDELFMIPDSREGWVEALEMLLSHYLVPGNRRPAFDYSMIRKAGQPLKGFGGVSSGPDPLKNALETIGILLARRRGHYLSVTDITDIMNIIGKCVVSGNVRRSAEIAFGDYRSEEFLDLKNYERNPERAGHGWVSNNSIMADVGMDYGPIVDRILANGEPGLIWLDNMRRYSRMGDAVDDKDAAAEGSNPCVEYVISFFFSLYDPFTYSFLIRQTLESYELCCLVETFPNNHDSDEDFMRTLEIAYLYAKTVTLGLTHWPKTNAVMQRNHRMGVSMSGVAQYLHRHGNDALVALCDAGYAHLKAADNRVSALMGVPTSIKLTSVKPSGTVSLLAGATPGLHHPISAYYIRRVRLPANSPLVHCLQKAGYFVEDAKDGFPGTTKVVEIPVSAMDDSASGVVTTDFSSAAASSSDDTVAERGMIRTVADLDMEEQFSIAALLQRHWADNAVSCTVTFDPETTTKKDIVRCLNRFQHQLKGISFLPDDKGVYAQMPYEEITREEFYERCAFLEPVEWDIQHVETKHHVFCDGIICEIRSE